MSCLCIYDDVVFDVVLVEYNEYVVISCELVVVGICFEQWQVCQLIVFGVSQDEVIVVYCSDID